MKTRRWLALSIAALGWLAIGHAQPAPIFTRPGSIVATDVVGQVQTVTEGKGTAMKLGDTVRGEIGFKTGRRSTLALEFSNATTLRLGVDSEIEVEEFWQIPHSQAGKPADWKEEPSPSRATLKLVRGDLNGTLKPLKVARGSSFTLELIAGTLRVSEGSFRTRVQMTELGLGLCTVELTEGKGEFEPKGGKPAPLTAGKKVVLSVEVDARGNVKLGDGPTAEGKAKK